jgi:hypothetical protein
MRTFSAAAAASLVLAACMSTPPARLDGSELVGQIVRVQMAGAGTTQLRFNADGTVTGSSAAGQATGQWVVENGQLCMDWPRLGRDCYPYEEPFRRGQPVTLTGTSGASVQVTLE